MVTRSTVEPESEPPRSFSAVRHIHLRVSPGKRQAIYDSIQTGSRADMEYAALVALAALIALFGLLQNSAAVIIGAMLISPMMNPLLAGALALLLGDGELGRRSSVVLGSSVLATVAITWFIALLIPLNQLTPEILARTTPNLLDLFIAFLSGLAGTIALRGGSSSLMILPGVAIAVAVVPPLAVVGYGLSTRQFSIAAGAFLLFLTNLVAIVISSALVFRSMGFRPQRAAEAGRWKLKYRMTISAAVLLVLSIPLFLTLRRAVSQIRIRSAVSSQLAAEFHGDKASVNDFSVLFAGRVLRIHATVRTAKYLDAAQIGAIEKSLQSRFGSSTQLQVDQILVAVGGVKPPAPAPVPSQNAISGGGVRPVQQATAFDFKASEASLVQHLQSELDELLATSAIQRNAPLRLQLIGTPPSAVVGAAFTAPEPIAPQTIELLQSQLSSRMNVPIQLHGSADVSAPQYQYAFSSAPAARVLSPSNRRAIEKVAKAVQSTPSLRLEISYNLPPSAPSTQEPPLLQAIQSMLPASGLKPSQWNISHGPRAGETHTQTASKPADNTTAPVGKPAAPQVQYDLHIMQDF